MPHYRPHKARVEHFPAITPAMLGPGDVRSFTCEGVRHTLLFDTSRVGYGERRYFLCPFCGERRSKLHLKDGQFGCVKCHDLQYTSSQVEGNRYSEIQLRALRVGKNWVSP